MPEQRSEVYRRYAQSAVEAARIAEDEGHERIGLAYRYIAATWLRLAYQAAQATQAAALEPAALDA